MDEMDEQVSLPPNTHNPVTGELVSDALKIARDKARAAFAKCGTVSNVLDMKEAILNMLSSNGIQVPA